MPYLKHINTKPNCLYTFDNFFTSQNEISGLKADVFGNNLESVILTGSNGSGVTHLLSAICNTLINQNKKVLFITAQWLLHINKNLKNKQTIFLNSLKEFDVIAIDNIQFLYRKSKRNTNFILDIINQHLNSNNLVLLGCSDHKKDFTKSKNIMNSIKLKKIELRQLSSFDIYKLLKQLCSMEDNIPDNLIYAISGYNGTIQQHINCLISIRFNMKAQCITTKELSIEQFDQIFDLKKYFQKQQFRKCFNQTQLKFTKGLIMQIR